jgi:plastocyanin
VQLSNVSFQPASLTVAAGTTVTFVNEDRVRHTVTSGERGSPDGRFNESLGGDDEVQIVFDEPGTVAYFCELHSNMAAEIVVE